MLYLHISDPTFLHPSLSIYPMYAMRLAYHMPCIHLEPPLCTLCNFLLTRSLTENIEVPVPI